MDVKRRTFLTNGLRFSLGAGALHATAAHATLCADPEELSSTDYSFRKYVQYTESSPNEKETCSQCISFRPGQGDCGTCQAVAGSINAHGHCTGWSARAAKK